MEIDRYSDSYTVYTLMQLKEQYPDGDFYLIIGSDMFLSFHKWYRHQVIMDNCTLCVASRSDADSIYELRSYAFSQFRIYIKELEGRGIIISPMKPFKASSSEIRSIIKSGNDASEFLTAEVYDYIKKRGLYGYGKK